MSECIGYVKATAVTREVRGKKDPSKVYGFQTLGLRTDTGMFKEFDAMYDPAKASNFLPPGDYEIHAKAPYLDFNGRLAIGKEFVPVKAGK